MAKLPERSTPESSNVICAECGAVMVLRTNRSKFNKDGTPHIFYGCSTYPECGGSHGAHQVSGLPLGVPADKETKQARIAAHEVFDELWISGEMTRTTAYRKLSIAMGRNEVHFADFSKEECLEAIRIIEEEF